MKKDEVSIGLIVTNENEITTRKRKRSVNLHVWDRYDELPAPFAHVRELPHDFFLQVPGQNENIVRLCLLDTLRREDGNVRTRRIAALLVRTAIDCVIEKIGTNAAVVEQRVPLPWRTVTRDRLAGTPCLDQKCEYRALGFFHLLSKPRIGLQAIYTASDLAILELGHTRRDGFRGIFHVTAINA